MKLKICEDEKGYILRLSKSFTKKYGIKAGMSVYIEVVDKNNFKMIIDKKSFLCNVKKN